MRSQAYRKESLWSGSKRIERSGIQEHHEYGRRNGIIERRAQNCLKLFTLYIVTHMKKLRVGDPVMVIAGKFKGKISTVQAMAGDRVTVKGVNEVKKAMKGK